MKHTQTDKNKGKRYEQVCTYYIDRMHAKALKAGDRMPSLRECSNSLGVSRTTAETAYLQLAMDGYIYAIEKVGYFVTPMAEKETAGRREADPGERKKQGTPQPDRPIRYDFKTIGEDPSTSCLDLWRRYLKSALRQEDRLLSYADNQGEEDLRREIAAYVRRSRNIICSPEDIIIGAGFQSLLSILIPLLQGEKTVSFPTRDFTEGATSFADSGYRVSYRDKEAHVIYVTPAYMTKWGEVMTMKRRHEILRHAAEDDHILIEDDYQNEFVFSQQPTPSLYAMAAGENVAYLSSFSRVLLPSVRISFLILPKGMGEAYKKIRDHYNQTASKAEQIALTQFLRDGQLLRHIRKMRRCQLEKRELMLSALNRYFPDEKESSQRKEREIRILSGDSGMEFALQITGKPSADKMADGMVSFQLLKETEKETMVLLSCSRIPAEKIDEGIRQFALCIL